jgi:hypothetical protein
MALCLPKNSPARGGRYVNRNVFIGDIGDTCQIRRYSILTFRLLSIRSFHHCYTNSV